MSYNFPSTLDSLKKYGLFAKKNLGQNFILDKVITDKIVSQANNIEEYSILEVGPGPGGLTKSIINSKAKEVLAIEKDERFLKILNEISEISNGTLKITNEDALRFNYESLKSANSKWKIIANLPYNIATELLLKWLSMLPNAFYDELILMFQKEVAERIVANVGDNNYGRLAIFTNLLCETKIKMHLSPEDFTPPPKVSSAIVRLRPRKKLLYEVDLEKLKKITNVAFNQRRKTINNSLKKLNLEQDQIVKALEAAKIQPSCRPESISIEQFCSLTNALKDQI